MRFTLTPVLAIASILAPAAVQAAKENEAVERLDASADVLTDMMKADDKGIPQDLLNKAKCVIIVPNLKKAAFVVGGKFGRGFASCRRASGTGWTAPAAIRIEGGSFGFQIGASEQDVILLVMNDGGMKRLLGDKFTIGAEATAAAGPVGREASAQTDAVMRAEMLSYSRSRGLFAGISLQGATLRPDEEADHDLYGRNITNREILTGDVKAPAGSEKLEARLNSQSSQRTK
jgi:lipid-binding SYLF domain-containing protein